MFIEFRDLAGCTNDPTIFMKKIHEILEKQHPLNYMIKLIKMSGIAGDIYGSGKNKQLLDFVINLLRTHFIDESELIDSFVEEVKIIDELFEKFKQKRIDSGVESIPNNVKILSFIYDLREVLEYVNVIKENKLSKTPYVSKCKIDSPYIKMLEVVDTQFVIEEFSNVWEFLIGCPSMVMKYFYFDKKLNVELNTIKSGEYIEFGSVSAKHFELFEEYNKIYNLFERWKFFEWSVNNVDLNIVFQSKDGNKKYNNYKIQIQRSEQLRLELQMFLLSSEFTDIVASRNNADTNILPPDKFMSYSEFASAIMCAEFYHADKVSDVSLDRIPLPEWIRAYSVIQKIAHDAKGDKGVSSSLIYLNRKEIVKKLIKHGIQDKHTEKLIKLLTFNMNKSEDFMDCPLIKVIDSDKLAVIPELISTLDLSRTIFSNCLCRDINISDRGYKLESECKQQFIKNHINCNDLKRKHNSEEYQCDLVVQLENNLFYFEVKSFIQPMSIRSFYEHEKKLEEACEQLDRIFNHYNNNLDYVKEKLNLAPDWNVNKSYKIIVTTSMQPSNLKIGDFFIVDYHALSRFLSREALCLKVTSGSMYDSIPFQEFDYLYKSEITSELLLEFFKIIPSNKMMEKHFVEIDMKVLINETNVIYYDYFKRVPTVWGGKQ